MCDGLAERALGRARWIHMDPLVVARRIGKAVDAALLDLEPIAGAERLADSAGAVPGESRIRWPSAHCSPGNRGRCLDLDSPLGANLNLNTVPTFQCLDDVADEAVLSEEDARDLTVEPGADDDKVLRRHDRDRLATAAERAHTLEGMNKESKSQSWPP